MQDRKVQDPPTTAGKPSKKLRAGHPPLLCRHQLAKTHYSPDRKNHQKNVGYLRAWTNVFPLLQAGFQASTCKMDQHRLSRSRWNVRNAGRKAWFGWRRGAISIACANLSCALIARIHGRNFFPVRSLQGRSCIRSRSRGRSSKVRCARSR